MTSDPSLTDQKAAMLAMIFGGLLSIVLLVIPPAFLAMEAAQDFITGILGSIAAFAVGIIFGIAFPIVVVLVLFYIFSYFFSWRDKREIARFKRDILKDKEGKK